MYQLESLNYRALPNGAHCGFCSHFSENVAISPQAFREALGELPAKFDATLAVEKSLLDWSYKSDLTKQIKDADKKLDLTIVTLKSLVKTQTYSQTATIATAATRVYDMLSKYKHITNKPYTDKIGDVESILRNVKAGGTYANDITTLALPEPTITSLISNLGTNVVSLKALIIQRGTQQQKKPDTTFIKVRREIETIYHQMAKIINSGAVMGTLPHFEIFIELINVEIKVLNSEYHKTRLDIVHSEPEPIETQYYTGKPINPTPEVIYKLERKKKKEDGDDEYETEIITYVLEPGKDYYLKYKDNIEIGNAQCIVSGINKYKGTKIVTFVIERRKNTGDSTEN